MIPILYDNNERTFASNGLGRLADCLECTVTEQRNGVYEAEFIYPITGVHYKDIIEGRIISVTHDEKGDRQPFVIYRRSAVIDGRVTFYAHHVSYDLSGVIVSPFSATSPAAALTFIKNNSITDNPFEFWTDKASGGSMEVDVPTPAKALLGGREGSILDVFGGGEYEFDGFTVKLYQNRGHDSGVTIRYGKNLTNLRQERETLDLYNAVVPYWRDNQNGDLIYGDVVTGNGGVEETALWTDHNDIYITDENGNEFEFKYVKNITTTMDLSQEFEEMPTKSELEERALQILNSNQPWVPSESIDVDFVALWQTEEYKSVAPLQRVGLCDTVSVYYPELGVDAVEVKVVKTVYNVLLDRFDSLELGQPKASFAEVISAETSTEVLTKSTSMMEEAIEAATSLITGGMGGHVVFSLDANGKPQEILIMDTEDAATAVHVLRMNVNGIGFSSNGINGPFNTAWTLNGNFVADFITAGTMQANRIKGGTLTLGGSGNGNGTMVVYDADGNLVTEINNLGTLLKYGNMLASCGLFNSAYYTQVQGVTIAKMNSFAVRSQTDGVTDTIHSFNEYSRVPQQCIVTNKASYQRIVCVGITDADLDQQITSHDNTTDLVETVSDNEYDLTVWGHGTSVSHLHAKWTPDEISIKSGIKQMVLDATGISLKGYTGSATISGTLDVAGTAKILAGTTLQVDNDVLIKNSASTNIFYYRTSYNTTTIKMGDYNFINGVQTVGGVEQPYVSYANKKLAYTSSSSRRYKENIADLSDDALNPEKLYDLPVRQFRYKKDAPLQYGDLYGQTIAGFIAEEVDEIYPSAVIRNDDNSPESWDERRIIPPMLVLIKEQRGRIEKLEKRVEKLEKALEMLMEEI